jgi:predicted Zn-dependent peptidase
MTALIKHVLTCFIISFFSIAFATPLPAQEVHVVEKILTNGMTLLMVERHDDPSIAGGWVAHVGSANERPGITGIAHLFEHMMFKGTTTIGTTDYAKDSEILTEQEKIRDEMRAEESKMRAAWRRGEVEDWQKPENWTPHYRELQKQFQELVLEERKLIVKNEIWKIYQANGGNGMNAFTMDDMTAFFVGVPANKLKLWMWLESERIYHPVFREFYAERDVVFEERRMRYDSRPLGPATEEFNAMFWQSLPYSWPTIGWPSDIASISKPQADAFHAMFYSPQNITLILVGDFDPAKVSGMAENYFGRIPRGKNNPPDLVTTEVKQEAEKRMNAEVTANPQVDIMWHTVPFAHKDAYALQILAQLLSTHTGRLYKGLVLGSGVATDISASQNSQKWAGWFDISGEAADGHTPEEVEKAIYAELDKLKHDPVPPEELQKVKNNFAADQYRQLNSNMSILQNLIWNDGEGDWREINAAQPKLEAVTAADVMRVANEYFTKDNRAVAIFTRKPNAAKEPAKE